MISIWSESFPA